jgi:hypothetical protein
MLGLTGGALYAIAPAWTCVDLVQRSLPLTIATTGEIAILTVAASSGAVLVLAMAGPLADDDVAAREDPVERSIIVDNAF